MNHCLRHYEEPIAGVCRSCQQPFCTRCLVFSFGPKKPPYCVGCALYASGIRSGKVPNAAPAPPTPASASASAPTDPAAGPATIDKRTERAMRRAERDALKLAAKAAKRAQRSAAKQQAPASEAARPSRVPAPSQLVSNPTPWPQQP